MYVCMGEYVCMICVYCHGYFLSGLKRLADSGTPVSVRASLSLKASLSLSLRAYLFL